MALLLAIATLAYWNFPAWIVRHNLERYQRLGVVDLRYLGELGPDAIPQLVRALPALAPVERVQLRAELLQHAGRAPPARWFEWSWRRVAAERALQELTDQP